MPANHLPPIPSVESYKQAFRAVQEHLNDGQMAMLRAQYIAPDRTCTATELAFAAGYTGGFRGTNLQYGKMGTILRRALGYWNADGQRSYVLSLFYPPGACGNTDWLFEMHAEVAQALTELGWFRLWKSTPESEGAADE